MIDKSLEINHYFNNKTNKPDLQIKNSPYDFVVQERTSDNILCTNFFILDIEKYIESVNFLTFVFHDKLKTEEEIKKYLHTPCCINNDELQLRYKNLEYIPLQILDKELRTRVYKILSYNPLINTKTVNDNLIIKKSDTNTYIFTLMKIMMNTVDACKLIERNLNSPVSFAGNKDKKAVTYQEVSIKCNFFNLLDFAYEYTNCSREDYENIKIFKLFEDIDISDEERLVISEGLGNTKRIRKETLCNLDIIKNDESKEDIIKNNCINTLDDKNIIKNDDINIKKIDDINILDDKNIIKNDESKEDIIKNNCINTLDDKNIIKNDDINIKKIDDINILDDKNIIKNDESKEDIIKNNCINTLDDKNIIKNDDINIKKIDDINILDDKNIIKNDESKEDIIKNNCINTLDDKNIIKNDDINIKKIDDINILDDKNIIKNDVINIKKIDDINILDDKNIIKNDDINFNKLEDNHINIIDDKYPNIIENINKPEDYRNKLDILASSYYDSSIGIFNIRKGHSKRLGDLKGNKFTIRIKNQSDLKYKNIEKGFINYYGTQRFGKAKNNHFVGEKILNKEYTEALDLIIKNSKGYDSFIKGDITECLKKCDNMERYIFKNKGVISDKKIVLGMRREIRMIYLHSYQSYLFNKEVNEFIENYIKNKLSKLSDEQNMRHLSDNNISSIPSDEHKMKNPSDNNFSSDFLDKQKMKKPSDYNFSSDFLDKNIFSIISDENISGNSYDENISGNSYDENISGNSYDENIINLFESSLDLKKMNDRMLKGGTRKIFEKGYNVEGWKDKEDFVISFELKSSCYATMALREL